MLWPVVQLAGEKRGKDQLVGSEVDGRGAWSLLHYTLKKPGERAGARCYGAREESVASRGGVWLRLPRLRGRGREGD